MTELVDLHIHSTYSDGSKKPKEIISLAKKFHVTTIAITDHDNIDGSKELIFSNHRGLTVYSGVEMTALYPQGKMHLLGYNMNLFDQNLNQLIKRAYENSIYNLLLYIDRLQKEFNISLPNSSIDHLLQSKGNVGRLQLAQILVELGYAETIKLAFKKYLVQVYEHAKKEKKGILAEEIITVLKASGAIVSLAHPESLLLPPKELRKKLVELKEYGLEAMETIYSGNSESQTQTLKRLARQLNLFETGGTDFHGYEIKPHIKLGTGVHNNVYIPKNSLSLTKKRSRYQ